MNSLKKVNNSLNYKFVGLIPARSGSKRVKNKNISIINGKNLIQRSIECGRNVSRISEIVIATDSKEYESMAKSYGATSYGLRTKSLSKDSSTDKEWLLWICKLLKKAKKEYTHYVILRPTSPFRTPILVNKAIDHFLSSSKDIYTTLRAISKTKEHPGKMWVKLSQDRMSKLLPFYTNNIPWSDQSYSTLPSTYIQNACLEIGSINGILDGMPISGFSTIPFLWEGIEVLDINTPEDLEYANYLAIKFGI